MTGMMSAGGQVVQLGLRTSPDYRLKVYTCIPMVTPHTEIAVVTVQRRTRILKMGPRVCLSAVYRLI